MPELHARLSASGAHRWLRCPGSIKLEKSYPDTDSIYTEEGTVAHFLAEKKLRAYFGKDTQKNALRSQKRAAAKMHQALVDKAKGAGVEIDTFEQMERYTDIYLEKAKEDTLGFKTEPVVFIEEMVNFDLWVPEGFGTADCIMLANERMIITDFKYGKGVKVDPEKNEQLMLYALGAYQRYGMIFPIKNVTLQIIQPRIENIDSWGISMKGLLRWADEAVAPIAIEAYNGSDKLEPGDHCRFCKAKAQCPKRAEKMFQAVEEIKENVKDIKLLGPEQLGYYLKKSLGITEWIKDMEEEALDSILKGEPVPGFKAVEGRSIRAFKDQDQAMETLIKKGYKPEILFERKALSLSKLEKLIGKKEFNDLVGDQIIKPQGKPTLVEESDKRQSYVANDATKMFEEQR